MTHEQCVDIISSLTRFEIKELNISITDFDGNVKTIDFDVSDGKNSDVSLMGILLEDFHEVFTALDDFIQGGGTSYEDEDDDEDDPFEDDEDLEDDDYSDDDED